MGALVIAKSVTHRYGKTQALRGIDLTLEAGRSIAFIGPDGVGKSTLLGLIAGAKRMQEGALTVFGGDVRKKPVQREMQQRIAYMPQGLGRNLYPELSIRENLEFFSRLYEQGKEEREQRIRHLLSATGLLPFIDRPAGKLSGGMKQKLSLCCALIHDPELLILDEPTTGVDPLSRRQFWMLIDTIHATHPGLTVLVATSYMEEAEQFDHIVMMDEGRILAEGTAAALKAQCGEESLERAFIAFLPEEKRRDHIVPVIEKRDFSGHAIAIEARGLTKRFGDFTAVDHVDFRIPTGEIYGFLGSNGCGKSTTMKMLTGLLPVTEGESFLFGKRLVAGDIENRKRIGYMSQAFSLYSELTVDQNLTLHAHLYGIEGAQADERIHWLYDMFGLGEYRNSNSGELPLGVRQRLSLAVAVIHSPEILILDEPTSGVDPIARDNFWALLIELSQKHHVTIFVSTHFMNEAARCDRISLMHAGKVIATGAPDDLQAHKQVATLDEAFIAYLEEVSDRTEWMQTQGEQEIMAGNAAYDPSHHSLFSPARMMAYLRREILELRRDPVRLGIATIGMAFLMLVFGYGITLDVDSLRFAVLDRDHSPESRRYIEEFSSSSYFSEQPPLASESELIARMKDGSVTLALEIPPDFGKDIRRGTPTSIAATIDGAMPFRAETIGGYAQGIHMRFLADQGVSVLQSPLTVESRFRYNQSFESVNAMVPSVIALMLMFIPAILSALAVVREKEMGSISNLYVTPVSRAEFILGKQIPYILFAMVGFAVMFLMAVLVFQVPFKGSVVGIIIGALLYTASTTGLGLFMSSFTRSQTAALFGTAIATVMPATQFSGMLRPVSSLEGGGAYWVGICYPTTYFMKVSIGAFTKGLDLYALLPFLSTLALFAPALLVMNICALRKQEL